MKKLEVFDPPMCCSSGVCGPKVDPALPRFAGDLEWLKGQGVDVKRYNLAQQPMAFAGNETVRDTLDKEDVGCLPLILADDVIVSRASYPSREALAVVLGVELPKKAAAPKAAEAGCCCGGSGCCG